MIKEECPSFFNLILQQQILQNLPPCVCLSASQLTYYKLNHSVYCYERGQTIRVSARQRTNEQTDHCLFVQWQCLTPFQFSAAVFFSYCFIPFKNVQWPITHSIRFHRLKSCFIDQTLLICVMILIGHPRDLYPAWIFLNQMQKRGQTCARGTNFQ